MNSIYRKSRVVTTYSLILIDLLVVVASYCLALLIRFHSLSKVDNQPTHLFFGILLVTLSLLYAIGTDWNRDFFKWQPFYDADNSYESGFFLRRLKIKQI